MPRLYHKTASEDVAREILNRGFIDGRWDAVWLSTVPLSVNEGTKGDVLLAVDVDLRTKELFYLYEVVEREKPYREFVIPAAVINERAVVSLVDEELQEGPFWNEYPEGEPDKTLSDLDYLE